MVLDRLGPLYDNNSIGPMIMKEKKREALQNQQIVKREVVSCEEKKHARVL